MRSRKKERGIQVVRATRGGTLTRIRQVHAKHPERLGPKLGITAIEANIPPKMVALVLGATEPSVFRWYYGMAEPLRIYRIRVFKLIQILERAMSKGELPIEAPRDEVATRLELVVKKYVKQVDKAPALQP